MAARAAPRFPRRRFVHVTSFPLSLLGSGGGGEEGGSGGVLPVEKLCDIGFAVRLTWFM